MSTRYCNRPQVAFLPKRVYQRKVQEKKYVDRNWITVKLVDQEVKGVYCNICLAFAESSSAFTNGFTQYSHIYERISDHESSETHNSSVMAFIHAHYNEDISSLVNVEMVNAQQRDVQENIRVLERIVSVIKYLAKRSLSFREHRNESAYTLDDRSVDHGNALETVLLISEYDVLLNSHYTESN